MTLSVHTNLSALVAQKSQGKATSNLQQSMMRLSTGLRINSAKDDAAGVGISSRLNTQTRALEQGKRNNSDGLAVVGGLDGLASSVEDMLGRMKELAVQAKTGTYSTEDRESANTEFKALMDEIESVSSREINSQKLDGALALTIQTGAKTSDILTVNTANGIGVTALGMSAQVVGVLAVPSAAGASLVLDSDGGVSIAYAASVVGVVGVASVGGTNILTETGASAAMTAIDSAVTSVSKVRGQLGSSMNRMEQITVSLDNQIQGTNAVLGSIQDTDFASETTKLTKNQILQQASTAMLAQANQLPQAALSLLG